MGSIIAGVVLIAIGLVFGRSVFLGDFSVFNIFFDGLGIVFIVRGIIKIMRSRPAAP
jgi:hypothetical protein